MFNSQDLRNGVAFRFPSNCSPSSAARAIPTSWNSTRSTNCRSSASYPQGMYVCRPDTSIPWNNADEYMATNGFNYVTFKSYISEFIDEFFGISEACSFTNHDCSVFHYFSFFYYTNFLDQFFFRTSAFRYITGIHFLYVTNVTGFLHQEHRRLK